MDKYFQLVRHYQPTHQSVLVFSSLSSFEEGIKNDVVSASQRTENEQRQQTHRERVKKATKQVFNEIKSKHFSDDKKPKESMDKINAN